MNNIPFFSDLKKFDFNEDYRIGIRSSMGDIITGISCDSRSVKPGNLFVAIRGEKNDGINYLNDAIKNGARFICINKRDFFRLIDIISKHDVFVFAVDDTSSYLGYISSLYYNHPSRKMNLIGITGTNGKTTTTYILESILKQAGINSGVIGTVNIRYNNKTFSSSLTTPDQIEINRILRDMADENVSTVAMEVSSHALQQKRVYGLKFKTVVFTNLSHDHLDYHITMENYFQAKARLFNDYEYEWAVINIDDEAGKKIWDSVNNNKLSYGFSPEAMVRPRAFYSGINGIITRCITPKGEIDIKSRLIGRHNLLNILAAISTAITLDIDISEIKEGIENIVFVPGRLEPVVNDRDVNAFVDYAHTPDALKNVLTVLRELVSGKIILIFGCGGNRDKDKRPLMAEISESLADHIIITSDNPRDEDPNSIIRDILGGAQGLSGYNLLNMDKFMVIPDRRAAIKTGVALAGKGDCILVAGKGHENYQIFGAKRERFVDKEEMERAFGESNPNETYCDISLNYKISARVGQILKKIDGEVFSGNSNAVFVGISTDTRSIEDSNLFIALKGEKFDAHDFMEEAVNKGASTVIINRDRRDLIERFSLRDITIIGVEDTLFALGDLAKWHKERLGLKTIAITGSCGKTSSKEFISEVLSRRFPTIKTKGNFNNLVGLPLTLFGATPLHQWAVLEMGMNKKGEIKRLTEIAKPDIALITTIQPAHLSNLGGISEVMREKKAVWEALYEGDTAIVNMDDPIIMEVSKEISCYKYGFSFYPKHKSDNKIKQIVWCKDFQIFENGKTTAIVDVEGEELVLNLKTMGRASVQNALSAVTIGRILGISLDEIRDAIENVNPVKGRLSVLHLGNNFTLIDDSYNANPASMKEALENLVSIRKNTKKIAIIGDMLELGDNTHIYHKEIGNSFFGVGVDEIIYVGEFFSYFSEGENLKRIKIRHFERSDLVLEWLEKEDLSTFFSNSTLLVKASNSVGLKKIVEFIINRFGDGN